MGYYEENAKEYIEKTKDVNMQAEYEMLLKYLPKNATILDVGFGSARDTLAFKNMGYDVYCLDTVKEFCNHAISCGIEPKRVMNISILDLKNENKYDGIWACASLLHLTYNELIKAFKIIEKALKKDGYFYASFKYGDFEGIRDNRYYTDLTEEKLKDILVKINMSLVSSSIKKDKLNRDNKWINIICKKYGF